MGYQTVKDPDVNRLLAKYGVDGVGYRRFGNEDRPLAGAGSAGVRPLSWPSSRRLPLEQIFARLEQHHRIRLAG